MNEINVYGSSSMKSFSIGFQRILLNFMDFLFEFRLISRVFVYLKLTSMVRFSLDLFPRVPLPWNWFTWHSHHRTWNGCVAVSVKSIPTHFLSVKSPYKIFQRKKIVSHGLLFVEEWFLHSSSQLKTLFSVNWATSIQISQRKTFLKENLSTEVFPWTFLRG